MMLFEDPTMRLLMLCLPSSKQVIATQVEQAGGRVFYFPTLLIEAIEFDVAEISKGLIQLQSADWIIVTSQHAIMHLPEKWQHAIQDNLISIACIGPATGAACRAAGFEPKLILPSGSTSETLIAKDVFAPDAVARKDIIILSGEGGRSLIFDTLIQRGAHVVKCPVYRRVSPKDKTLTLAELHAWGINHIYVMSGEALENLIQLTETAALPFLKGISIVTLSERLKQHAEALGFLKVDVLINKIL